MSSITNELVFFVNGKKVKDENVDPETSLLEYLRTKLRLTGSKLSCGQGGCGACTVMVSSYDRTKNAIRHHTVNACLMSVGCVHGKAVTTVEGLGSTETVLHPVQERLAKSHGTQCGFCSPGFVMTMYTLLRNNPLPSRMDIEEAFQGNLCRCTGYRPILDGYQTFSKEYQEECAMGDQCCKNRPQGGEAAAAEEEGVATSLYNPKDFLPYDPSQEAIFPSELQLSDEYDKHLLQLKGERLIWYRPTNLRQLLKLRANNQDSKLVMGGTVIGFELKSQPPPVVLYAAAVRELQQFDRTDNGVTVGAAVSISSLQRFLAAVLEDTSETKTRFIRPMVNIINRIGGEQIRNVGTLGGGIMAASPVSDLNALFVASGASVTVVNNDDEKRTIPMDEHFFTGRKETAVKPDEIIVSINIPFSNENDYMIAYKQAPRKRNALAIVNAALTVTFQPDTSVTKSMRLVYGGMAAKTEVATNTAQSVLNRKWDETLLSDVARLLTEELSLQPGAPGGKEVYRQSLVLGFFFKFYVEVGQKLQERGLQPATENDVDRTACIVEQPEPKRGVQVYEQVAPGQSDVDPVGRPLPHVSAFKAASGEAQFVGDLPAHRNELHLVLVVSSKAHANITNIDASAALAMPGVLDFLSHKDVKGKGTYGFAVQDEYYFAPEKVESIGQPIGAIVADTRDHAYRAAQAVNITYEELDNIVTIEEAIAKESFHGQPQVIRKGDTEAAFAECDHVLSGEVRTGAQEHFYMETFNVTVIPGEEGELTVYASCQDLRQLQSAISEAMQVSNNKVVVKGKRTGGGFGGKELNVNMIGVPAALAARKHKRPVRAYFDRNEDMTRTSNRHPFLGKYKVGFTSAGKILAMELDFYSNAGRSGDMSPMVMQVAMFNHEGGYQIPNVHIRGILCHTNLISFAAFRGFGQPQATFIIENIVSNVATSLGVSQTQIRELNMFKEGDMTHWGVSLTNCTLQRCYNEALRRSDYHNKRSQIDQYNKNNRWRKRGLAVSNIKISQSFYATPPCQGAALVHVYTDGSVLLSFGGVELGQGIYTKMHQIASRVLKVPMEKIYINETSTDKVPNATMTAGSMTTDINGPAVVDACQTIRERIEPYMQENPKGSWEDWVHAAYADRVSLSTTGFYKTPPIDYDWEKNEGNLPFYFSYGTSVSQVEIDCLTGEHQVLRTDIVMDVGSSLNPAIDVGQIEGAFLQGYGLMTIEEQRFTPSGYLVTQGTNGYKIPVVANIPNDFNVYLLKGSSNPKAVYSSKAIGEPPLSLSVSVFLALKDAISAARNEAGLNGVWRLDAPCTPESIRLACQDRFTQQIKQPQEGTYTPWSIRP